jgi:hypothetical protein
MRNDASHSPAAAPRGIRLRRALTLLYDVDFPGTCQFRAVTTGAKSKRIGSILQGSTDDINAVGPDRAVKGCRQQTDFFSSI